MFKKPRFSLGGLAATVVVTNLFLIANLSPNMPLAINLESHATDDTRSLGWPVVYLNDVPAGTYTDITTGRQRVICKRMWRYECALPNIALWIFACWIGARAFRKFRFRDRATCAGTKTDL